jgi:hypothetical protein
MYLVPAQRRCFFGLELIEDCKYREGDQSSDQILIKH